MTMTPSIRLIPASSLTDSYVIKKAILDVLVNIDLRAPFLAEVNVGKMHIR